MIITVRDHGQGVDPKKLDQLTTPFFRGDAARTAATGAGLGLAIVEKARAAHGRRFELANATRRAARHIRLQSPRWSAPGAGPRRVTEASRAGTTARASIASPFPTGPIFSAVFALTLT